ncbi:DNA glycosylase AlkZ-like family protein [Bacillus horti]|uniref:Uncharacterized protein YcaQ n=1 Tax=Caldalkalibacillus horti TaxID=77523 RepID=A0ABT9VTM5_9BACI|nr:crosslink repair DNA glycosylase YcaQ family protein [Bacillus horti]MDQ0164348.1 uncharacterized protein YcaQ [Bacillus horti]
MKPIKTSKQVLRRFLLDKQFLLPRASSEAKKPRTEGLVNNSKESRVLELIQQLECVQIDPVAAVKPNHHLVLGARIEDYQPEALNHLLQQHRVFEYMANALCVIPMEDYALFEPTRQRFQLHVKDSLDGLKDTVNEVLASLDKEGPLMAKAFQSGQRVHGYWDNQQAKTKATTHALNLLTDAGMIRVVNREGNQRYFDLTTKTVPSSELTRSATIDQHEASRLLIEKYLKAYRVFEPSDSRFGWQRFKAVERREIIQAGIRLEKIQAIQIEDVQKEYYILNEDIETLMNYEDEAKTQALSEEAHIYFLPPLDNLLWSRQRLVDLFDFYYRWEIYTPANNRTFGYYTMPLLFGDALVGRVDPQLDRKKAHLTFNIIHIEEAYQKDALLLDILPAELKRFAREHGAKTYSLEKSNVPINL